eukprot:TRINITY_DN2056_c0_g1_i1.p1 TRINITY_DN2056_c0_g1~~TRINITY_DN2056_c0_g1_i1.p1  ORF type:complete len:175 (-),score=13.60 TRINITY_DN2056_c0_g1_i1:52-576(-)
MRRDIGGFGKCMAITVIVISIIYILLTIPYWVAISSGTNSYNGSIDPISIALWALSGLVLLAVATCGLYGSIQGSVRCLHMFGVVSAVMWILGYIQLILFYVTMLRCDQAVPLFVGSPFDSICKPAVNDLWLWVPNFISQFIAGCAACVAFGTKQKVINADTASPGSGGKEFFG